VIYSDHYNESALSRKNLNLHTGNNEEIKRGISRPVCVSSRIEPQRKDDQQSLSGNLQGTDAYLQQEWWLKHKGILSAQKIIEKAKKLNQNFFNVNQDQSEESSETVSF